MLAGAALAAIAGYQRWISPRKGYACAYRIAHGGTGCSGYAKQAIRDRGLIRALPQVRARFRACHAAAMTLREKDTKKDHRHNRWYHWCDITSCCDPGFCRIGGSASKTPDGCDCTPDACS